MISTSRTKFRDRSRTLLLFLVVVGTIFGAACDRSENIWSAQAKSPDGKVIAVAQAVLRNKGLSVVSGIDTNVYLNWAGDTRPPMLVLNFADGSDSPSDTAVDMTWLTPTHLQLTYKGNRIVGFQAVKWAGIDISVRDLTEASEATGAVNVEKGMDGQTAPNRKPGASQ